MAADAQVLRLRSGGAVWREIDRATVVLDVEAAAYLATNASGTVLWRAMVAGATIAELVTALMDTYAIDRATAEENVESFVATCRQHGFLES